jgi:hypothetical protein
MSQSSTRNNFSDILLDPTTIGLVGSIALHAILGANLAFFTPSVKEIKKPEPGTVKVVELTPSELQRIPQSPPSIGVPNPSQIVPPIYQPSTPVPPVFDPAPPQVVTAAPPLFAPAPANVPLPPKFGTKPPKALPKAPVVITSPKQKVITKPPAGKKDQKAVAQAQPAPPQFDPDISFKPTPEPTPAPTKPEVVKKPSPSPTQPPKQTTAPKKPSPKTPGAYDGDYDGDIQQGVEPSKPVIVGQNPTGNPTGTPPQASPSPSPQPTPETSSGGTGTGTGFYGKSIEEANDRLQEYEKSYPGILERSGGKAKELTISYPTKDGVKIACPKGNRKPFIVYMIAFGKFTPKDSVLGGEPSSEELKQDVFYDKKIPENESLSRIAIAKAIEAASTANDNREEKNRNKEFLYQYKVQFDPKTCKS